MICPKCKREIPEKSLKCDFCNTRIASLCKKCNAYNSIYNLKCVNCKNELLKICPSCKGINLPEAIKCRKCDYLFKREQESGKREENELSASQPLSFSAELYSQQKAKELLKDAFLSEDKKIISLNGDKGIGKTIVLKSAINDIQKNEKIWLLGECTPLTQISPYGLIQDILLTFFNVSNFCLDNLQLKKDSQKFFQSEFPTLTNEEIFNLLNFLYPTKTDYFENILENKEKTFSMLKKVFRTIVENNKTVIIIENFDFIDGLSYEFLHKLLEKDFPASQLKFLLTYDKIRPVQGYLYNNTLKDSSYLNISLASLDKNQINLFIDRFFEKETCPKETQEKLAKLSGGNPAKLEQFVSLLIDKKSFSANNLPQTFHDTVKLRLELLKNDKIAYKTLCAATIQGLNFSPIITNQVMGLEENVFLEIINLLQQMNFIIKINENFYAFKNSSLWNEIFEIIKQDEIFSIINTKLFEIYSKYILSSNSIMAIISQNLNQDLSAFNFWTHNIKLASYIGDTNLYAISQKQCLNLIEKLETSSNSLIKNNIYERLGKLLSKTNSNEAIKYLPKAIQHARQLENPIKELELTGYLAQCCMNLGNYYGTIECINAAIDKIDTSFDLEIAMLKSRKLNALLNIGNSGEIVNLVDNEILPVFEKYLNAKPHKNIPINSLYKAWVQTYLSLAEALIFQGNNRSFEILSTLFELFLKNEFDNKLFICKTKLALAMANTIKGDTEKSESILEEIIKVYKTDIMDNEAISRWNLINILNNFVQKKYSGIKEELFQVVTFANNTNDHFTKNVLKTLLGKLLRDEDNSKQALDIYTQQITYFSKEKNAIGALLGWYLIAEAKLTVEGPDKSLEVSQKALDVAQGPKINNYLFTVLLNKVIAEAHMAKSEYEFAKVYIEKAILIARKFELLSQLADLYLLYGKYLQDLAIAKSESQTDYVIGSHKMYKKASLIAQSIKNNYLISRIEKAKAVLNSFCQLKGIVLKGEQ